MILIVVKWNIRPEFDDQWLDLVRDFTESTRAEPGNLFFEWSRSADTPHQYVLIEAFADGDAGTAHVTSDHFKTALEQLPAYVATKPDIINAEIPNTGWSEMAEISPR